MSTTLGLAASSARGAETASRQPTAAQRRAPRRFMCGTPVRCVRDGAPYPRSFHGVLLSFHARGVRLLEGVDLLVDRGLLLLLGLGLGLLLGGPLPRDAAHASRGGADRGALAGVTGDGSDRRAGCRALRSALDRGALAGLAGVGLLRNGGVGGIDAGLLLGPGVAVVAVLGLLVRSLVVRREDVHLEQRGRGVLRRARGSWSGRGLRRGCRGGRGCLGQCAEREAAESERDPTIHGAHVISPRRSQG